MDHRLCKLQQQSPLTMVPSSHSSVDGQAGQRPVLEPWSQILTGKLITPTYCTHLSSVVGYATRHTHSMIMGLTETVTACSAVTNNVGANIES